MILSRGAKTHRAGGDHSLTTAADQIPQAHAARPDRFVLIHQMGKVGSQSIRIALQAHAGVGKPNAGNSHRVSDDSYRGRLWHFKRSGATPGPDFDEAVTARKIIHETDRPIDLIVPVREPISRNVSNFFYLMSLGSFPKLVPDQIPADHSSATMLRQAFYARADHRTPIRWFGEELHDPFGINALDGPFDHEAGFRVTEHGRVRLLLMRCELPDERKAAIIAAYLGIEPFELARENAGDDHSTAALYKLFKSNPALMPEYGDWMLDSDYAKAFYTDAERADARARWCAPV